MRVAAALAGALFAAFALAPNLRAQSYPNRPAPPPMCSAGSTV